MCETEFIQACLNHPDIHRNVVTKRYKKKRLLETAGTPISHIGFVLDGFLKAITYTKDGKELCSSVFTKGSILLEYLYLSGNADYTFDLVTLSKARISWIPVDVFAEAVLNDNQLLRLYIKHLAVRGVDNQRMITCLGYKTIRERICYWISSEGNLELDLCKIPTHVRLPVSQEAFAALINVTRASLNQELHRMEDESFFKLNKKILTHINKEKILANL
ncbi:Crp/Fnr family transcriptional regulator [Vagococcus acidifermentans]|uniref:Cyclic nucleotide-binding protein n=1 Tax=Vagococcus acidifermentans TaxID=564710 RepID=A0A430AM75_9ENTE|nr:Crp/Fnr family transcriptional regulator [Vagococcus acidifermentans]RSU09231.1 cyclic nucleotide-binding protein [Vagococcus acidifermentans]